MHNFLELLTKHALVSIISFVGLMGDFMKLDISHIVKTNGASLDVTFNDVIETLNSIAETFTFDNPITFNGQLLNVSGRLKLTGRLEATCTVKCCRCLTDISKQISIDVQEEFVNSQNASEDAETYTYSENYIELNKVLQDNIILNLPLRLLCSPQCKGLCGGCGKDLNINTCTCTEPDTDPRMDVLKKLLNN